MAQQPCQKEWKYLKWDEVNFGKSANFLHPTYYPLLGDSNIWYVDVDIQNYHTAGGLTEFSYSSTYYTRGDSTIANTHYKKFFIDDPYSQYSTSPTGFVGLIREDTVGKKVYFLGKDSSKENLIYDFSLKKGDTMAINMELPKTQQLYSLGPLLSGKYETAISTASTLQGTRNKILLSSKTMMLYNSRYYDLQWVESIGSLKSPLYFYEPLNGDYKITIGPGLSIAVNVQLGCVFRNGLQIYGSGQCVYDYTQITMGIPNSPSTARNFVSIFPNPASDKLNFDYDVTDQLPINDLNNQINLEIYNGAGKRCYKHNLRLSEDYLNIDISEWKTGVYFYRLSASSGLLNQDKFIIQH